MQRLSGIGVCPGIVSGRAVILIQRGHALRYHIGEGRVGNELTRFKTACARSRQQLLDIRERVAARRPELASLFDEDADFVHVNGLCWHDRESIRKAHASRLQRVVGTRVLSPAETKVKLLSPEVAIVHSRMALSDGAADNAPGTAPGTTIVSFVVHRAGERWLCASAHNTDLMPEPHTEASGTAVS